MQLAAQRGTGFPLGEIEYNASPGYSAFANFLDDFSGQPGAFKGRSVTGLPPDPISPAIVFLSGHLEHYAFVDADVGVTREHPGQFANALRSPAFTGFDPALFFQPNRVQSDNKDLGPAFGFA